MVSRLFFRFLICLFFTFPYVLGELTYACQYGRACAGVPFNRTFSTMARPEKSSSRSFQARRRLLPSTGRTESRDTASLLHQLPLMDCFGKHLLGPVPFTDVVFLHFCRQWGTRAGPLCDEPIRNVRFRVIDATIADGKRAIAFQLSMD